MPIKKKSTPGVAIVHSNRQMFTYSENKLLDQITTEIMEAWKKDLLVIRAHHKEIINSQTSASNLSNLISSQFPRLEKFLEDHDFINKFSELTNEIGEINSRHQMINKTLFDISQKLNFDYVKKLIESMKTMQETLEKMNKRRWWHRFLKPKT